MADESYTLIIAPGARGTFRKLQVSARLLRWSVRGAAAALVGLLGLSAHYVWLSRQMSELQSLRASNAALAIEGRRYTEALDDLQGRLAALQKAVTKLGVMSGVEPTLPEGGGLGGVTGAESSPPSRDPEVALRSLDRSLSQLAERSTRIATFYAGQTERLAHTPSVWPVRGYLSSGFGNRADPFTGQRDFHSGIDISAPRGSRVLAPADGVVVAVGQRGAYGQAIIVDHGFGVITRYGHLDGYNVRAGDRVSRGDVIGFVGDTGRSNAPHLHYEVWVQDEAQNPIHYILDEYRSFG
jgi:murein DD-endopeptidase MepM/ murein hydrolase activator NlpD